MNHIWIFFIFFISLRFYIDAGKKRYENYKIVKIEGQESDVKKLIGFIDHLDRSTPYETRRNETYMLIEPSLTTALVNFATEMAVTITVKVNDYSKLLETETHQIHRRGGRYNWSAYYDIDDLNLNLMEMQETHPLLSTLMIAGESFEGRKIVGIRILSNVPLDDNTPKPIVILEGGTHGREWMSPATVTYFVSQLLTNNSPKLVALRNSFDWHIFPVVNPDGYHYSMTTERLWRKSRSKSTKSKCVGVDLNRNYDYNFGVHASESDPCDYQIYAGPKPFSEPETRSMSSYISKLNDILAFVAIHASANCIMVPYSNTSALIKDYHVMEDLVKKGNAYSKKTHPFGTSETCLGLRLSGLSMDWVYQTKQPPITFTYELDGQTFFEPSNKIPEYGETVTKMLTGIFTEALQTYKKSPN